MKTEAIWILIVATLAAGWGYREVSHNNETQKHERVTSNLERQNLTLQQELSQLRVALAESSKKIPEQAETDEKPSVEEVFEDANELIVEGFNTAVDSVVEAFNEQLDRARELLETPAPDPSESEPSIPI